MKKLRNIFETKVDILFFVFACSMLVLLAATAQALVHEIADECDNGAEMLRLAVVTH
jgi:hypothetical protein